MSLQRGYGGEEEARGATRWARSRIHLVAGLGGPMVGLMAAVTVALLGWSLLGVLITFAAVAGVIALGLPEAIVGPDRVLRAAYGLLPVATTIGGFVVAAGVWEPTWLPLIAGGVAGSAVGSMLQRATFPGLTQERDARWRRGSPRGAGHQPA